MTDIHGHDRMSFNHFVDSFFLKCNHEFVIFLIFEMVQLLDLKK